MANMNALLGDKELESGVEFTMGGRRSMSFQKLRGLYKKNHFI